MAYFLFPNIAVRAGDTTSLVDVITALNVVDLAASESVITCGCQCSDILLGVAVSLYSEITNGSVFGQLTGCGEDDLVGRCSGSGIPSPHSPIEAGLRGDNRTSHQALGHDASEVTGLSRIRRDAAAKTPQ